jgi:hypothetical protein
MLVKGYWMNRLKNKEVIDAKFLSDKNVVGFGNVALTSNAFRAMKIQVTDQVAAPDWFYFSLLSRQQKIIFTSNCSTLYRQHGNNTIGIKKMDADRLQTVLGAKRKHYEALAAAGISLQGELDNITRIENDILINPKRIAEAVNKLNQLNINYFWWEETNFLNG